MEFRRDDTGQNKSSKCFGFVQSYDDRPKRRLFELLKSQGMQENQQVAFLSDGGEDVRNLQFTIMHRETFIAKLTEVRRTVEQLRCFTCTSAAGSRFRLFLLR